jgi:uncharacterized repeat protein (TIGR02543 family)
MPDDPVRAGYTFMGWESTLAQDATVLTGATVNPQKNNGVYATVTYTAQFEPIIFTLTYAFVDENGDPITTPTGLTLPVSRGKDRTMDTQRRALVRSSGPTGVAGT